MRFFPLYLSVAVALVAGVAGPWLGFWDWAIFALAMTLSALGFWDMIQQKHSLRRNYPILANIRFLLEKVRPEIRQYFLESDSDGTPYNRNKRAIVYQRAKGQLDKRPFGTQQDVNGENFEWLAHSMAPRKAETADLRVRVGGANCLQPYALSLFNISAMSFGSLSANAIRALNKGAKLGGFAHDTGEGGFSPYHQEFGGDIIWEIGSGYFGSQHSAFSTPLELVGFIKTLRDLSGGKPVGFKLCIGNRWEFAAVVKAMLETGIAPDFIVVDGKEGGTGAAPLEFTDHVGTPLRDGLTFVHNCLVGAGLRNQIRIGASGRLITAFDMVRVLALGADWCNAARGFMFALGCVQSLSCHTDRCPTGVATQDPQRQRALFVPDKAERVANFHRSTLQALSELIGAAGLSHPRDIHPRQIMKRLSPTDVRSFADIYPSLRAGELLHGEVNRVYAQIWAMADSRWFDDKLFAKSTIGPIDINAPLALVAMRKTSWQPRLLPELALDGDPVDAKTGEKEAPILMFDNNTSRDCRCGGPAQLIQNPGISGSGRPSFGEQVTNAIALREDAGARTKPLRLSRLSCHKRYIMTQANLRLVEGSSVDKTKALDAALSQIERAFGKGSIMRLGKNQKAVEIETISTGSIGLDIALGVGGLPRGRVIEIYGPESSGKTTLTLHVIAEAQKNGGVCAFVDAEHALDPVYARKLGVNLEDLLISQPDTGEQALEITDTLVRSGAVDVLVIDSVAALTPRAEIEGEMGDVQPGLQARLMSQALRKLTASISRSNTMVIFINQIRMKIGVMYGSPETTTGGNALKFYASVRLDIRRTGAIKDREEVVGNQTRVKVVKNKVAPPFKQVEFDIMYGEGISKNGELVDLGVKAGVVEKSGSWFSYDSQRLGQGRENAKAFLRDNPEAAARIERSIRENAGLIAERILDNVDPSSVDAGDGVE
eukprot:gene13376-13492_t